MWLVVPPIDELSCCWVTDFDVVLPGEWADEKISAFVVTLIFTEELGVVSLPELLGHKTIISQRGSHRQDVVFDRTLVP